MRKFLALLALVASLTVTACGGDDAPPTMMPPPDTDGAVPVPPVPPPPDQMGAIMLTADVDGMVQIDGVDVMQLAVGQMPWRWEVPAGSHTVTVANPNYVSTTWTDTVAAGQDRTVEVRMGPAVDGVIFLCETSPSSRQAEVRIANDMNEIRIGNLIPGTWVTMRGDIGSYSAGEGAGGFTAEFASDHRSVRLTATDGTGASDSHSCTVQE